MSQPIRTLARILLVPAALAAVAFAGQSAALASPQVHFAASTQVHFAASPQVHFSAQPPHVFERWA